MSLVSGSTVDVEEVKNAENTSDMKKCENITCSKCIYVYVKYIEYDVVTICASLINIYTVKRFRKFEEPELELASALVGYIPHTLPES